MPKPAILGSQGRLRLCPVSIQTQRTIRSCSAYATRTASSMSKITRAVSCVVVFLAWYHGRRILGSSVLAKPPFQKGTQKQRYQHNIYPGASTPLGFLRKICPRGRRLFRALNLASTVDCCLHLPSMLLAGRFLASIRFVIKTKQLSRS